ncbi:MAG: LysR substrate-binding domain-containing protein [Burkholderiales bacterium]
MKLRPLECLCEIRRSEFNLSRAAGRLHASQPAVTRQIQLLEQELGFEVLVRRRNKVVGLSPQGEAVIARAERILYEAEQLRRVGEELRSPVAGRLVVATTHIHARYTLLKAIKPFRLRYPGVSFSIQSGDPSSIAQLVATGQADLGISVESTERHPELVSLPCYPIGRVVITPVRHPLLRLKRKPTLEDLAQYPIIVYDRRFSGGLRIVEAFERRGLAPDVVLTATDAEVIKAYVAEGLGIAAIQSLAYSASRDVGLRAIDADHLFGKPVAVITVRRGVFLPRYTYDFLRLLAPKLTAGDIDRMLSER